MIPVLRGQYCPLCENIYKKKNYLHSQKGKYENEQEEKEQKGEDRGDGVHQGHHQVTQARPVSRNKDYYNNNTFIVNNRNEHFKTRTNKKNINFLIDIESTGEAMDI